MNNSLSRGGIKQCRTGGWSG